MNNAGEIAPGGHGAQDDGWFEPFRVFFDRTFAHAFSEATELCAGDESRAAHLCAQAFGRTYARWAFFGRIGDAEAFISRRLRRGIRNLPDAAPLREAGVGYKPWVYVTATETGTSRKQVRWLLSGAATAACGCLVAFSALTASPERSDVSISGENPLSTPASNTSGSDEPPSPGSSAPLVPDLDLAEEDTTNIDGADSEWTGFTLNLVDLPKSPSEIDALSPTAQPPTTLRPGTAPAGPPDTVPSAIAPTPVAPSSTAPPSTAPPSTTPPATPEPPATTLPPPTLPPKTAPPATTTTSTIAPTTTTTSVAPSVDPDNKIEERERARQERENEREERKREREEAKNSDSSTNNLAPSQVDKEIWIRRNIG